MNSIFTLNKQKLLVIFFVSTFHFLNSQTTFTIIDPNTNAGNFENATSTFAANGWTQVGASSGNSWYVGTGAGSAISGSKAAYLGSSTTAFGSGQNYAKNHFYRDVIIPAGATNVSLTFYYRMPVIDGAFDQLLIYTSTSGDVPVAGTTPPSGGTWALRGTFGGTVVASFTQQTVDLTAVAGNNVRLNFCWKTDAASPYAYCAVDYISLTYQMTIPVVAGNITGTTTLNCAGATTTLTSSVPSATGGTATSSGNIRMNKFTSSGTFTPNFSGNVEVMVVGGGGGGGVRHAGGGGAGGMVYNSAFAVSGAQTVTVGAGGASATNGSNSVFGTLTAIGGGFGSSNGAAAGTGGSGGGGSNGAAGAAGTAGQGNKGGNHAACCFPNGCGGGGAGAAGVNTSGAVSSAGGIGIYRDITGSIVAYAGGGGGGKDGAAPAIAGGIGGGGLGGTNVSPYHGGNGTANTGGGGGGGGASESSSGNGGTGGSGIVAVRYLVPTSGTWSSSNTAVATVDVNTGVVTAVSNGSSTITYTAINGSQSATASTVVTVSGIPTLDGATVNTNCWTTNGSNDYQITIKASSSVGIGGSTYGMLALVNFQGANAGSYGGYYAWNTTQALLTAQGYTQNQMACTGGGWVGMATSYGGSTASLISATTSVSGNQRTVTFTIRPNATFPKLTNNSISQYAMSSAGCAVGWVETGVDLFTSTPALPTPGTITVNGDSNTGNMVTICPGQTIAVSQSGWNNQGGTTYFYSDNTSAFGGWTVAPDWEIMSYGSITAANQVSGQNNVNNLTNFNYTINNPGVYILHTNANYGNCYTATNGLNRYITVSTPVGNPATYGSNSWIGYVYNSTTAGDFTAYTGFVTESETFDRNHGGDGEGSATGATTSHCSNKTELFAIRYRMTKTFAAGYYTFTVGGDDGVRLSLDGGSSWHIGAAGAPVNGQAWGGHGYVTYSSPSSIYLNGSVNLVFEFYENSGGARTSFTYSCVAPTPSAISGGSVLCANGTRTYSVTNVAGLTYNWTLPSGWSGSSTTNSITVTANGTPGTLSVTAQGGCSASAASSLVITFGAGPTSVSAGADVAICSGGSTSLSGSATGPTLTGSQQFVWQASGNDGGNYSNGNSVTGTTSGLPTGSIITSITYSSTVRNTSYTGTNYCGSWWSGTLFVNNENRGSACEVSNVAYNLLNGSAANGQTFKIQVADLDGYNDLNYITLTVNVNYSYPAPVTYSWTPTTFLSASNVANPTLGAPMATDTYTMTATSNGCGISRAVTVTVNPIPTASISPATATICSGSSQNLTASGGGTYAWSNGGGSSATASFSPTQTTVYTVTVTNNGCSATATRTIRVPSAISIPAITGTNSICQSGGTTQFTVPYTAPTGGTVSTVGAYTVHTFTSNANFVTAQPLSAEIMVVGGGGSGGPAIGGGGGGGAVVYVPSGTISANTYPIVIGAGGVSNTTTGFAGVSSTAFGMTALGGGTSGRHDSAPGTAGGSGGGAASNNTLLNAGGTANSGGSSLGSFTGSIFGNNGGSMLVARTGTATRGAGGGGAGSRALSVNSNYVGTGMGKGGDGIPIDIDGNLRYWAGGGGGGGYYNGTAGFGGLGGGGGGAESDPAGNGGTGGGSALNSGGNGARGVTVSGGNGGANTGGGGGAGSWDNGLGGSGGSGIVIVRYPTITNGTWESSNTSVATVNSSGLVTSVGNGAATISYHVVIAGCTTTVSRDVVVRVVPAATATNSGPVCAGTTVNLTASNLAPGGQVVTMSNNGTDNIVATTHTSVLNNHTIEFWVNPSRTIVLHAEHNSGVIANLGAPTTEFSFAIAPNQSGGSGCSPVNVGVGVSVGTNGVEVVQHGPCHFPVPLSYAGSISGWTHIAVVHISNVPYLYVNGNLVKVGMTSLYPTFPNSSVSLSYGYFGGSVDNIRVWNNSRTANQIVTDMNREVPSVASGLIHNLPLNGNGTALTGANATINSSSYTTPTFYTYTWSGLNAPTASTNQTQTSGNTTGGNYTVVATSAGCSGTTSAATTVTVNNPSVTPAPTANDYVWTGAVNTDWATANNWLQWDGSAYIFGGVPNAATANVNLPTVGGCIARNASINAGTLSVNNLNVMSGHTFTLANTASILNIAGTWTMNGTWGAPVGNATVNFNGTGNQSIPALTYSRLQANTGGIKSLTGTTSASNVVTVGQSATLDLGSNILNLSFVGAPFTLSGTPVGILTALNATVNYTGAGDQTVRSVTYGNLGLSGSGTKTITNANIAVNNLLTLGANITFNLNATNPRTLTLSYDGMPIIANPTSSITFGNSTVSYASTGNNQLVYPATYNNLTISTNNTTKTLAGDVVVNGNITLAVTNRLLQIGDYSLTLNGGYFSVPGNVRSTANSTLIINCPTPITSTLPAFTNLKKLVINSTGSTFTTTSNIAINDELTLTEGNVTLGAFSLTFTGNNLSRTNGSIDASNASSTMVFGTNATALSIPANLFSGDIAKLTLNRAGGVTLGSATTVANTLTLTSGTLTVGPNTFTMNGSTLTRTSGSIDASNASATLAFGNSTLLTLPASVFSAAVNNLTLNGTRVKATTDFTVNGILNLNNTNPDATNGLLDLVQSYGQYANTYSIVSTDTYNNLNSAVLTLGASSTVIGDADITGKVRRTTFVDGQTYAFNNKNMQLTFDLDGGVSLPTQITVVATKGAEGLHLDKDGTADFTPGSADTLIGGAAVKRLWQVLKTGGSPEVKFDIRFPYEDSELNGNSEADLVTWDHHLPYAGRTPHEHGKTNVDATNNWVELSGHGIGYLATEGDGGFTKYWMLAENVIKVQTWLGAAGGGATGDWYSASNWSKGAIPTVESILIPNAASTPHDPDPTKLPDFINLATIEIQPGGILNGGSSEITLSGGPLINGGRGTWLNNGTFTAASSKVIFDYTDATIAGSTNFNDITVNTGKKVTIQANSNNSIGGTVVNNGTFDASSHTNTVSYTGSGQSIIQPNGTTAGYHNLTIAQTSGTAIAAANLNAKGSVLVSSGTFDLNNKTLNLKGDFTNNATVSNPGAVTLSGTGAQAIGGTSVTTFSDLTINGGSGTTTLNQNINVSNVLAVDAGKTLNATDKTILLTGSGTPFANSGTFTQGTSTVHYNNAGATNIAALTYNNLQSTGAATKTVLGNITVGETLTMNAGTLDLLDKTFAVKGLAMSGGANIDAEDASIILNNPSSLTLPANLFVSSVKNLTTNAGGNLTSAGDIALNGTLALTNGSLDMNGKVLTMEPTSTWTSAAGSLDATNSKIVFKSPTFEVGVLSTPVVKDLEFNRSTGIGVNGNLEVTGLLKLADGTVDIHSNTLKLSGLLDAASVGSIDTDNGTVDFNNSTEWNLPSTFFASNVKTMKVSGVGGLQTNTSTIISDLLEMTGGNIKVNAAPLEIGKDATTVGSISWTGGTVVGPLKRWFANATNATQESGIFPVGTAGLNRYAQINFTEAPEGGYLVMEFHTGAPAGLNYETDLPIMYLNSQGLRRYIQNADESGYWEMTPYNAAGEPYEALDNFKYNLALRINNPTSVQTGGILNNPPGVKLIRAKGYADGSHGDWELAGTYSTFEELNAGEDYVVKSVNVQGFSWFNGGGDNQNPLPIELLSFTGFCGNNQATINWKTASEFNSSYFIVEKSTDGQNWREVTNKEAAGISNEELSYQIIDLNKDDNAYYRLTQYDVDGEFTVYDPIFVSCNEKANFIKTYPNPSDNSFQVLVSNKALVGKATIQLIDTKGTIVSVKEVEIEEGTNLFYLNENMAPGIYYLSINNGKTSTEIIKHSVK